LPHEEALHETFAHWSAGGGQDFRSVMQNYSRTRHSALAGLALAGVSTMGIEPKDFLLFSKGSLALKPQLSVSEAFNDNIFYRNEDKVSDFITTLSPGLNLQYGSHDYNFIDLSYTYDRLIYVTENSQDANQHHLGFDTHFEHSRLTLTGHDQFEKLSNPLGGGISFSGEKVDRTVFFNNYRLEYELSEKTTPYIDILHSAVDYQEGLALYDNTTVTGTVGFDYKAFSRTSFFGEAYYGETWNDPNTSILADYPTAKFIGGFVGARGNFTEKLTGSLKAGYEVRSYSPSDLGSRGLPVVQMDLTEQFSENTILTLGYSHRQLESVQFTRAAYTSDAVTLGLLQQIGNEGRFRARLNASYGHADFDPSVDFDPNHKTPVDRTDNLISAGVTLTYDFKLWFRGFLGYNFEHLNSSTPVVLSYDVNRVTIGVTLGY
jgi:hypothetical protein